MGLCMYYCSVTPIMQKNLRQVFLRIILNLKHEKLCLCVFIFLLCIQPKLKLMNFDTFSVAIYISVYTKCITFILSWSNQQFQWLRGPGRDGIHYMTSSIIHHKRAPSCFCLFRCLGQTQLDSSHWLTSTAIKLWRLESSRLLTNHTHRLPRLPTSGAVEASTGGDGWEVLHKSADQWSFCLNVICGTALMFPHGGITNHSPLMSHLS